MNVGSWLLWGFVATVALTGLATTGRHLHMTRMNIPFMLGTIFTPNRDRAEIYGLIAHFINGWLFTLLYVAAFNAWDGATWWRGGVIGLVHAGAVLTLIMVVLPNFHPRMATELHGPAAAPLLQPPGFFARNYGKRTPLGILLAHLVYGAVFGAFYQLH